MRKIENVTIKGDQVELNLNLCDLATFTKHMQMALGNETRVRVLVEDEDYGDLLRYLNGHYRLIAGEAEETLRGYRKMRQERQS